MIFASPFLIALLPIWAGVARRLQGPPEAATSKLRPVCAQQVTTVTALGARAANPLTLRGLVLRTGPILHEGDTSSGSDRATPRNCYFDTRAFSQLPT